MYPPSLTLTSLVDSHHSFNTISMTNNSPRIPDSLDMQRLSAMQLTARMKETADKLGVGFIGGFVAPNGEKFVMTNMDEDDSQSLLPDELK